MQSNYILNGIGFAPFSDGGLSQGIFTGVEDDDFDLPMESVDKITFEKGGFAAIAGSETGGFNLSLPSTGMNRFLVVGITSADGINTLQASSVEYGGVQMTLLRRQITSNTVAAELWGLIAPAADGTSRSILVTFPGATSGAVFGFAFNGVEQYGPTESWADVTHTQGIGETVATLNVTPETHESVLIDVIGSTDAGIAASTNNLKKLISAGHGLGISAEKVASVSVALEWSSVDSPAAYVMCGMGMRPAEAESRLYTGTSALTHAGATLSGSATFLQTIWSATGAFTHSGATLSGAAEFDVPVYTGTSALTHSGAALGGSATFTPPTFTGTASLTHAGATLSGTAEFDVPVYTGTGTFVHAGASLSAAGSVPFRASAALTHSGATLSAAGSVPFLGTASLTHAGASLSGTATFTAPVYAGAAALTHSGATLSGSALFSLAVFQGSAALTHAGASLTAAATFAPGATGVAALVHAGATLFGAALFEPPMFTGSADLAHAGASITATAKTVLSFRRTRAAGVVSKRPKVIATGRRS